LTNITVGDSRRLGVNKQFNETHLAEGDYMSDEQSQNSSKEDTSRRQSLEQELQTSLEQIGGALRGLQFGSVNVIVQDGVVIQIDRTEKLRLRNTSRSKKYNS
jgi:hypothetical protein